MGKLQLGAESLFYILSGLGTYLGCECNVVELYRVLSLGHERRGHGSRVSCLTSVLVLMPKSNLVGSKLIAEALS